MNQSGQAFIGVGSCVVPRNPTKEAPSAQAEDLLVVRRVPGKAIPAAKADKPASASH